MDLLSVDTCRKENRCREDREEAVLFGRAGPDIPAGMRDGRVKPGRKPGARSDRFGAGAGDSRYFVVAPGVALSAIAGAALAAMVAGCALLYSCQKNDFSGSSSIFTDLSRIPFATVA